jgi:hypothetical protein
MDRPGGNYPERPGAGIRYLRDQVELQRPSPGNESGVPGYRTDIVREPGPPTASDAYRYRYRYRDGYCNRDRERNSDGYGDPEPSMERYCATGRGAIHQFPSDIG